MGLEISGEGWIIEQFSEIGGVSDGCVERGVSDSCALVKTAEDRIPGAEERAEITMASWFVRCAICSDM